MLSPLYSGRFHWSQKCLIISRDVFRLMSKRGNEENRKERKAGSCIVRNRGELEELGGRKFYVNKLIVRATEMQMEEDDWLRVRIGRSSGIGSSGFVIGCCDVRMSA